MSPAASIKFHAPALKHPAMKQLYPNLETAFPSLSGSDAFAFYENARDRLPKAQFPARSSHAANLGELADQFDVFVFDAYGVLNKGTEAVPGAAQRVKALQDLGKKTFVLTNGASFTPNSHRQNSTA